MRYNARYYIFYRIYLFLFSWPFLNASGDNAACIRKRMSLTLTAKGHRLKDYVIDENQASSLLECAQFCLAKWPDCQSINYQETHSGVCEINSMTRASTPQKLKMDSNFNYFEPVRSVFFSSPTAAVVDFVKTQGVYKVKSVITKRLLLASGTYLNDNTRGEEGGATHAPAILGSDQNYYNRVLWIVRNQGEGKYIFESRETKRYLFSNGEKIWQERGCEEGVALAPNCVASDDNYDDRAVWRIISLGDGKYLIESVVNFRYVFALGEVPIRKEGGWHNSPKTVMSDANYNDRAVWEIIAF